MENNVCNETGCDEWGVYRLETKKNLIVKCLKHGKQYNKLRKEGEPRLFRLDLGMCESSGCFRTARYGSPVSKFYAGTPKRCSSHIHDSDVGLLPRFCQTCNYRIGTHGKRGTRSTLYCYKCSRGVPLMCNNMSLKLVDYTLEKLAQGNQRKIKKAMKCFELIDSLMEDSITDIPEGTPNSNDIIAELEIEMLKSRRLSTKN